MAVSSRNISNVHTYAVFGSAFVHKIVICAVLCYRPCVKASFSKNIFYKAVSANFGFKIVNIMGAAFN